VTAGREPAAIRRSICSTCPFQATQADRLRASLDPDRRTGIVESMRAGQSFVCHSEAHGDAPPGPAGPRQCSGAAVIMAREQRPNLIMRTAVAFREPPFVDPGERIIPWATLDDWAGS
jgi:hypothetical protein